MKMKNKKKTQTRKMREIIKINEHYQPNVYNCDANEHILIVSRVVQSGVHIYTFNVVLKMLYVQKTEAPSHSIAYHSNP